MYKAESYVMRNGLIKNIQLISFNMMSYTTQEGLIRSFLEIVN
jgi:hypothetical protein